MNYPPPGQHMAQSFRPMANRRQSDYHYPSQIHYPPHQYPYSAYPPGPQYPVPPQFHPYHQQWYPPYQHYVAAPPPPLPPSQRQFQQQPHSPMVVSSHPNPSGHNHGPSNRPLAHTPQPIRTPQPEQSTPSSLSQAITSPSTTPTTTSANAATPPATTPKAATATAPVSVETLGEASDSSPTPVSTSASEVAQAASTASFEHPRAQFYPQLPWLSHPESDFPPRVSRRRRRRKPADQLSSDEVELPLRQQLATVTALEHDVSSGTESVVAAVPQDDVVNDNGTKSSDIVPVESQSITSTAEEQAPAPSAPAPSHRRTATKPVIPAVPLLPVVKTQKKVSPSPESAVPLEAVAEPVTLETTTATSDSDAQAETVVETASPQPAPARAAPKSWAELFARGPVTNGVAGSTASTGPAGNGTTSPKMHTLGDVLHMYSTKAENRLSFLEPRGLINTGNMCYMNSILQVLLFCVPFYDLLDQVGKRVAHSFKSDTPLLEAMIMFMREFQIIDSATSVEQLRRRLKDNELEQYGEAFIPEYVYDVIKRLPRFVTMRRGHQQDAEEFLGFLLEGLHDECVHVIKTSATETEQADAHLSPSQTSTAAEQNSGWMEVGPKQKASVTRSSGAIVTESPITKIFGGKLRSVLRIPGSKDSVTLEPYQPLQLDIGAPNINNITDALKGLTRSETLHGEFNSPRGPGTTATKQVFIETLPPVLILHLKRFQYDNTGGTQKIWRKIGYPLELEIPKEVFPQAQRANLTMRPGGLPKYRLISVVYHHGKSASGGHYTVDVRRQEGREWIRLDDTVIRRIRAEDVASEGSEEEPRLLAKALEQHVESSSGGSNIYSEAFRSEDRPGDEEQQGGGWSQVNGSVTSPPAGKKWSAVANGAPASSTSSTTTPGGQTPKPSSAKTSIKDNKVAYILFYQRVGS